MAAAMSSSVTASFFTGLGGSCTAFLAAVWAARFFLDAAIMAAAMASAVGFGASPAGLEEDGGGAFGDGALGPELVF